jgi:hypothetical protein
MRLFRFACSPRRLFIVLLALAFAVATVTWIFTFPFHPSLVLRVLPPEATVVSWHLEPAASMDALLRSAPVSLLLAADGGSAADVMADLAEPGVRELVQRLAGTAVALGFSPAYGQGNRPALFVGSWIGGVATHLMRGGWLDRSFEGFTVHRIGRDRIWTGTFPELPPGMQQVSFAVYEGVLAGCASSDPFAAFPLLLALKRHGPLTALAEPLARCTEGIGHLRARLPDGDGNTSLWTGAFDLEGDGRLSGHLVLEQAQAVPPWLPGSEAGRPPVALRALFPMPDDLAAAVVALPLVHGELAGRMLLAPGSRERVLLDTLAGMAAADACACVWVSGGDYSGRVMRLKVPSGGFALQVNPAMRLETVASRLADTLNSLYGTGLIAVPDRQHADIQVFRPVKNSGGLAFLGADELPALAVIDGWLVGMSNVAVLRRVLAAKANASMDMQLRDGLEQVCLYAHTRLPVLGELTGNALAGYALIRLLQTGRAERLDTPMVKRVLAGTETLGACTLRAGVDTQGRLSVFFAIDGRQEQADE